MNYIEWVELVCRAFADAHSSSDNLVGERELTAAMGLPEEEAGGAVFAAVQDLHALGMLDATEISGWIKDTQSTRAVREGASIRELWPAIVGQSLDQEQLEFLVALVERSERPGERWAELEEVQVREVFGDLGWSDPGHSMYDLSESVARLHLIERQAALGGFISVRPTYRGIVRATQQVNTEWQTRIEAVVGDWETTTVEFKEQLPLGTEKQKAEFARDVTALANTKASGRDRYLLIGFNNRTRQFETPVDGMLEQNRLEQILNAYGDPAPEIRYFTVEHPSGKGQVGVIEVHRDPTKLPHRIKHGGGKIEPGQVFVRHGSAGRGADLRRASGPRARRRRRSRQT